MFLVDRSRSGPPRRWRGRPFQTGAVVPRPHLPERLFIVGFMGAGKTTIGKLLSDRLHWRFVDLDRRIEEEAGVPIRKLFAVHGEGRFRSLEHDALREVAREPGRSIVALGGGAFVSEVNRAIVRRSGVSVWIDVPFRVSVKRVGGDRRRPLALSRDSMYQLYRSRLPFYHEADIRLRVGDLAVERIAQDLLRMLRDDWQIVAERRRLFS
ncbi:MAG TPA: shikimate kinase [Blastocatellia bacterium]|nr:shikimate kinase [Blastocatellia bacterium]